MSYHIDFGLWGGIFAVPTAVADQHLKLCSEHQLKVLLLALRDAPNPVDVPYIAKRLGLECAQVCDCLEYWQKAGLFSQKEEPSSPPAPRDAAVSVPPTPAGAQPAAAAPPVSDSITIADGGQRITTVHSRAKLTPSQINEMCRRDKSIPFLLEELQQRLSKPLSPAETETIVYLYSYLELTPDYLLMAAEYCKNAGKLSVRYLERLVTGWVDQGVDTHEKAEAHILQLTQRASNEGLIKNMFGLGERTLSAKERNFIHCWFDTYRFGPEMIQLAYDRTVDLTGKAAFPYLNKILTQWYQNGITTPQAAMDEMNGRKTGARAQAAPASYDLGDIQKLLELNSNT